MSYTREVLSQPLSHGMSLVTEEGTEAAWLPFLRLRFNTFHNSVWVYIQCSS